MVVENVPIERIHDNPHNPRTHYDTDKVKELASSVEQNGLLEVPKAKKSDDGEYYIAYGGYRLRAFRQLAKKDPEKWGLMPLDVIDIPDTSMVIFALEENLKRQNMDPMDTAKAVAKYFEVFPGTREEDLAARLSMSQSTISNMRRVATLPKEVTSYIDDGTINFTMGRELCTLLVVDGATRGKVQSKLLMVDAICKIDGEGGGYPATVAGIRKAIHQVATDNFRTLLEEAFGDASLFDTTACQTCDKALKTTGEDSKAAYHCLDAECWDIQQANAKRKKEEEEEQAKAEAEAKEAEEARLKAEQTAKAQKAGEGEGEPTPPETIPPEPKPEPRIVKVDAKRLKAGGDIYDAYSAADVVDGGEIRFPFTEEGETYVSLGDQREMPGAKQCYRLVPRDQYTGEIGSIKPREGEDAKAHRERLLTSPLGPYNGVPVTHKGKDYVLAGPMVVFAPAEAPPAPPPARRTPSVSRKPAEQKTGETVVKTPYKVSVTLTVEIADKDLEEKDLKEALYDAFDEEYMGLGSEKVLEVLAYEKVVEPAKS